jgi:RNA polymerase sigma-70 factor, ECF subfamily
VTSDRDLTGLLQAWSKGDRDALAVLATVVHQDLRVIARRLLADECRDGRWRPTELVQESYLRLLDWRGVHWQNRAHFFATAARMMRRILVDAARARAYRKRGGGALRVTLNEAMLVTDDASHDLVALNEALESLAALDPRKSQVVEMRFFGGLSIDEAAEALQVSGDTVRRDWRLAKVWLLHELRAGGRHDT